MKKCVCICLVCLLLAPLLGAAARAEDFLPAAQNVILADMDTGAVLYELNADERCAPASLTKIMTVLLAVEAIEAGEATRVEYVTAQEGFRAGLDDNSSSAGIQLGERLRLEELLYCAMLPSANESCNIIACRLGGSVEAFAEKMNARAAALGCTGTHFSNPNGLSSENHYTTARDLLLIAREAMRHELFAEICATTDYTVPATNMSGKRELENTNALLNPDGLYGAGYVYDGVFGVKTGYTSEAGYCLVTAVEREDTRLMAVVLGCAGSADTGYGSFSETARLLDWAFEKYDRQTVLADTQSVWTGKVRFGKSAAALYPAQDVTLFLPVGESLPEATISVDEAALEAPIAVGTQLGTATIEYTGGTVTVPLIAKTPVERNALQWTAHRLICSVWFWLALVILGLGAAYVISQRAAARRRRKRRMAACTPTTAAAPTPRRRTGKH